MPIFNRKSTDPVERQFRELEREGSGLARVSHFFAFLLIVLFSAGSLVALGADALNAVATAWQHGQVNVPLTIVLGVSFLLVLGCDVAMLQAAGLIRLLSSRQAEMREKWEHWFTVLLVGLTETVTYIFMSMTYEHPTSIFPWFLIILRAVMAPYISVYLSRARALPITSRDIMYQTELASGKGVVRDVIETANDTSAPLDDKVRLYRASAQMKEADAERLDRVLDAVRHNRNNGQTRIVEGSVSPARSDSDLYLRQSRKGRALAAASESIGQSDDLGQQDFADWDSPNQTEGRRSGRKPRAVRKLTSRDRIRRAIQQHPNLSDYAISKLLPGVSRNTVKDERQQMELEQQRLSAERIENAQ